MGQPQFGQLVALAKFRIILVKGAALFLYAAAFALLFFLSSHFTVREGISLWHPPAALRLTILILAGWRVAPLLAVAELMMVLPLGHADFWFPENDNQSFDFRLSGLILGSVTPPAAYALGTYVVGTLGLLDARLATVRHVVGLYLAATVAALLSAVGICAILVFQSFLPMEDLQVAIVAFWSGDVIAVTTLSPFLLIAARWLRTFGHQSSGRQGTIATAALALFKRSSLRDRRMLTTAVGLLVLVATGFLVGGSYDSPLRWYPFFLPAIWLALTLGVSGTAIGILVINVSLAALAAASDHPHHIFDVQLFMIILSGVGLLLAAAIQERDRERALLDARIHSRTRTLRDEVQLRRRAEAEARAQTRRAERYLAIARMWILALDTRGRITLISDEPLRILGYRRHELIGQDWFKMCVPEADRDDARRTFDHLLRDMQRRSVRFRGNVQTRSGDRRIVDWRVAFDRGTADERPQCLSSGLDVTEQIAAEQQAEYLATHDVLTGLPNRRWLINELQRSLVRADRRRERVAVLYLDLDGFKAINDRFGHNAGDAVLASVGKRISGAVRTADCIARVGGDEFIILLENVNDIETAARVGEKIVAAVSAPTSAVNAAARVGASIGVAIYPTDATTPDALIQTADHAMYRAKKAGGGQLHSAQAP